MKMPPRCNVDFCDNAGSPTGVPGQYNLQCYRHRNLEGVDWLVIPDPVTGSDAYLYDGEYYTVEYKVDSSTRGKFDGILNVEHSKGETLWFEYDKSGYIVIPRRSVRMVWA